MGKIRSQEKARVSDDPKDAHRDDTASPLTSGGLLKERAYNTLKQLILSETFPPGTFLSERQLVVQLGGMSKTPIRAALERLESDGFVSIAPKQGILVREISLQEIIDIFDIRIAIETFVVARLTGHLTEEQQALLEENLARAEQAVQARDEVEYARLDAEFHMLLCEFLDNGQITQVMQRNQDKLYRIIRRVLRRDKGRLTTSHADHCGMVEALLAGDSEAAASRVRAHLEYGKQVLVL